jgi:SOS response associated peptidase (SRAP)
MSSWGVHTRMPVILPEEHHDAWLSGEAGKEILVPYPAERMKAWPASARVNSPKNDDAEIIAPIELESVARFDLVPLCAEKSLDQFPSWRIALCCNPNLPPYGCADPKMWYHRWHPTTIYHAKDYG